MTKDGYGAQAKNTKELGTAMKLAGATQARKNVGDRKVRMYVLPPAERDADAEDLQF